MSHLIKTHWPFWLGLSNLIRCISQINHFNQLDWSKNTCFGPSVKMDVSINKNGPINQLKPFEKPCFVVMFNGLYDGLGYSVQNVNLNAYLKF